MFRGQTYNERKKETDLSTCLYFKETEQMTVLHSTSSQYPEVKQAAGFPHCFLFGQKVLRMTNFIAFMKN